MPQTVSTYDAALKDHYLPHAIKVLNNKTRTWKWMKLGEGQNDIGGRQILTYAHTGRSGSVGFMPAGATQPTSGNEVRRQVAVPYRQLWGFVRFNKDVVDQSRSPSMSWERAAASEMKAMTKNMMRQAEIAAWGIGSGVIGQIKTTATSATQTLRLITDTAGTGFNSNVGTRYFYPGMYVDILQAQTPTAFRVQGAKVLNVNPSAGTLTLDQSVACTAGDSIALSYPSNTDVSDDLPMGIPGLIDDGTYVGTIHGIDRSQTDDRQNFKANVINAGTDNVTTGALTTDMLQQAEDLADENGDGEPVCWWSHHSTAREYIKLTQRDIRYERPATYDPGAGKRSSGDGPIKTRIAYNDVPIYKGREVPYQTMFCMAEGSVARYPVTDLAWVTADGKVLYLRPGVAGQFEAQCSMQYNVSFKDEAPNSSSVVRFIASTVNPTSYS